MLSRRSLIIHLSTTALVGAVAVHARSAVAADKTVTIGINLPFTGADAHDAELIKDGAMMAIDDANAQGGVAGYKIEVMLLDDGTATAGQYDPAQAATNARKMVVRPRRGRRDRAADERLGQGDVADSEPGRSRDDHAELDQPRHHRPEIRRPVSAEGQGDLFPHRDDRRLPGPEHGQFPSRQSEGEIGLRARRQRRLRGRDRRHVPGRRPRSGASRCSAATSSIRRKPTTRRP